jgi:hypothetical protein
MPRSSRDSGTNSSASTSQHDQRRIAALAYVPLARVAEVLERRGKRVDRMPLSAYRSKSFYAMRTDALDRFGTRIEKRFTKEEVLAVLREAGLERVTVSPDPPFWLAIGFAPPDGN